MKNKKTLMAGEGGGGSASSSSNCKEFVVDEPPRDWFTSSRGSRFNLLANEFGLQKSNRIKFGMGREGLINGIKDLSKVSVIDPDCRWYRIWVQMIVVWATYSSFFTPMEFGFFRGLSEKLFILDMAGQAAFLVDIVLQFFVAYRDTVTYRMVHNRPLIALRYLKSSFAVDLLACMPWDLVYKLAGRRELVRCLLWIRLIRVRKVIAFFQNMEKDIRINYQFTRIVKLLFVEMYCTHTAACIFYYLATTLPKEQEGYTWIGSLKLGDYSYANFREIDLWKRYTTSLYFAIVTMATVGYGDIHAVNMREMIFIIIYVSFDMVLGAYLIGNMTAMIVKGSKTEKFRDKMTDVMKYMNRNRLDRDLRNQIKGHLRLQYESSYTQASVLKDIPISLRAKISQSLYTPYMQNVPLFKGCSSEFINQIVIRLHEEFFLPGEVILEQGNVVDQLYFVCDGVLERVGMLNNGLEETVSVLEAYSCFGEISILCNIPQPYTVRVCELCRLLRIEKQTFKNVLEIYFSDARKIFNNLLEEKDHHVKQSESGIKYHIGKQEAEIALKVNRICYDLDEEIVALLNQEGINHNVSDCFGNTPLIEAIRNGHDRVAQLLCRKGATLGSKDAGNFLCSAVARGDYNLIKKLLSNGIEPNCTNYDQRTPLHVAASQGLLLMAKELVEAGASVLAKDRWGNTPLDEARMSGNKNMTALLEDAKTAQPSDTSEEEKVKSWQRKCMVFPWDSSESKETKKHGVVLWVPREISELVQLAAEKLKVDSASGLLTEDGAEIVEADMIEDGQKLYLISETK